MVELMEGHRRGAGVVEEECVEPTLQLREAGHQQPGRSASRIVAYKTGEWKNSHDPPTRPNCRQRQESEARLQQLVS